MLKCFFQSSCFPKINYINYSKFKLFKEQKKRLKCENTFFKANVLPESKILKKSCGSSQLKYLFSNLAFMGLKELNNLNLI